MSHSIVRGSQRANSGKTIIVANPMIRIATKGSEPETISSILKSGKTDFKINRFNPTGGVIIPISILIVRITPNHMGSNPMATTAGNTIGNVITTIEVGSRRQPIKR